jgi:hypothetical protein
MQLSGQVCRTWKFPVKSAAWRLTRLEQKVFDGGAVKNVDGIFPSALIKKVKRAPGRTVGEH